MAQARPPIKTLMHKSCSLTRETNAALFGSWCQLLASVCSPTGLFQRLQFVSQVKWEAFAPPLEERWYLLLWEALCK